MRLSISLAQLYYFLHFSISLTSSPPIPRHTPSPIPKRSQLPWVSQPPVERCLHVPESLPTLKKAIWILWSLHYRKFVASSLETAGHLQYSVGVPIKPKTVLARSSQMYFVTFFLDRNIFSSETGRMDRGINGLMRYNERQSSAKRRCKIENSKTTGVSKQKQPYAKKHVMNFSLNKYGTARYHKRTVALEVDFLNLQV